MEEKNAIICKTLIEKVVPHKKDALMGHLSLADEELFKKIPSLQQDISEGLAPLDEEWFHIHPTWLKAALENYENDDQLILASCFPEEVFDSLGFSGRITLKEPAKGYFSNIIFEKLQELEPFLTPIEFVPPSPFGRLLNLSHEKINTFISLLGLHDLAKDMSSVLRGSKVKAIMEALQPTQQEYIKGIQGQFERVNFPKIPLETWDGSSQEMQDWITRRGLNRLAKIVCSEPKQIKAQITLALPRQYAKQFQELMTPLSDLGFTSFLTKQVMHLIQKLENTSTGTSV